MFCQLKNAALCLIKKKGEKTSSNNEEEKTKCLGVVGNCGTVKKRQ